jgi:hypothetical protein
MYSTTSIQRSRSQGHAGATSSTIMRHGPRPANRTEPRSAWLGAARETASTHRAWHEASPESARDAYAALLAAEEREANALAALLFSASFRPPAAM